MSGGKPAGYGGRMAGQAPNHFRGTASMDASGNFVIDDGKQILVPDTGTTTPSIANKAAPSYGHNYHNNKIATYAGGGANGLVVRPYQVEVHQPLLANKATINVPSTTQSITSAGDTILANATAVKITLNAAYVATATPVIAAGSDSQVLFVENVGPWTFTFQHETVLPGSGFRGHASGNKNLGVGDMMMLVYSVAHAAWIQKTWVVDT